MKTRTLLLVAVAFSLAVTATAGVHLQVEGVSATPGSPVEIPIRITTDETRIGALVFAIAFDSSRLQFDGAAKDGNRLQNVSVELPSGYRAAASMLQAGGQESVAISFWATRGTAVDISNSVIRLRFDSLADASGVAWVRVLPEASASSSSGDLVPVSSSEGGAFFDSRVSFLSAQPGVIDFGHLEPDTSRTVGVNLTNSGAHEAIVESLDGMTAGLRSDLTFPVTIAPGSTVRVPLTFTASVDGTHQWALIFRSSGRDVVVGAHATVGATSGQTLPTRQWIIPAAVRSSGASGTWTTSLVIHASGAAAPDTVLTYHGADGAVSRTLQLRQDETIALEDVVGWISPAEDGSGYIVVDSLSPDLELRSFTVRNGGSVTSDIIVVPVIPSTSLSASTQSIVLDGPRTPARVDVGVVNPGDEAVTVRIEVLDSDGLPVEVRSAEVEPGSILRINGIAAGRKPAAIRAHGETNGSFLLWTSTLFEDGSSLFDVAR